MYMSTARYQHKKEPAPITIGSRIVIPLSKQLVHLRIANEAETYGMSYDNQSCT
jgi:hypothetical protein